MALRKTISTRDPSLALARVFADVAELPRGARRVLEQVFWRERPSPREGVVLPLPSVRAPHPGTNQEA